MSDQVDGDLAARTRARLDAARARVSKLRHELTLEEALVRELQALVNPNKSLLGGRSGKAEIERRIGVISKILQDRGRLPLAQLHAEAVKVEGDDFSKQTLIDLLRRKGQVFVSVDGGWELRQSDSPGGRDPQETT